MIRYVFFIGMMLLIFSACDNDQALEKKEEVNSEIAGEVSDFSPYGSHKAYWYWISDLTDEEKLKMRVWINTVLEGTTATLGQYPFDLHFYFHLSDDSTQAVSFGHTSRRGGQQAVHFYVTPSYPLKDFMSGWKAPHEISHLSIPFIGKKNSWFSEGYATYLSRKIMIEMGYLTPLEFDSIYREKIAETKHCYASVTSSHTEISDSLKKHNTYSTMYWGCSSFFFRADNEIQKSHDVTLIEVVAQYQKCCRLEDENLEQIIDSFDEISGGEVFHQLLHDYQHQPSAEVMKSF
ncbi:MAG: hypothetical protein WDZ35_00360 [Crocinitomicaceae bacterium]